MSLRTAAKRFPGLLAGMAVGLLIAALTQVEVILIVIFGILLGFTTSPMIGITAAFGLYLVFHQFSQYVGVFASKADRIVRVIHTRTHHE